MTKAPMGKKVDEKGIKKDSCPVCGFALVFQEGCMQCYNCGWGGCEV